jgi:hypothetical protein
MKKTIKQAGSTLGILKDLLVFLAKSKKWWLTPVVLVLLLVGVLIFLAESSAVAPFIYTLF